MQDDLQAQTVRVKQSKPIYNFLTSQFNMWFEILENYRFIQWFGEKNFRNVHKISWHYKMRGTYVILHIYVLIQCTLTHL